MEEKHAWWLAALMDGEGSIMVRARPDRKRLRVCLVFANNHRPLLEFAQSIAGGCIYASRASWQLQINRRSDVERVLRAILPALILKREKALAALKTLEEQGVWTPPPRVRGRFVALK